MDRETLGDFEKGLLVFIVGMNALGLGMIANGWDLPDNLAWALLRTFFYIEGIALILILGGALMYGLSTSSGAAKPESPIQTASNETDTARDVHLCDSSRDAEDVSDLHQLEVQAAPVSPAVVLQTKEPEPPPPEPTAEELQEEAIEQIIGGW